MNRIKIPLLLLLAFLPILLVAASVRADSTTLTVKNYPDSTAGTIIGPGINCGSDCSEYQADGTAITLTASPAAGRTFQGWNPGVCGGQSTTCNFNMNNYYSDSNPATAYWAFANYTVTVNKTGSGSGSVSGASGSHAYNSDITLTAVADSGSVFSGWQTTGSVCYAGGGKTSAAVNTSATCTFKPDDLVSSDYEVVPKFDAVAGGSATNKPTTTPPPVSSPSSAPTPAPMAPAAPTTGIQLDNQNVTTNTPTISSDKPFTLSGVTIPGGVVTLYIFSTPQQATVTADAQGNWAYQVVDLEAGAHHIEATVTDPATNLTSDRVTLATFTIVKPIAATGPTTVPAKTTTSIWVWVVIGLATLGLLAGGVFWWWRKRGHKSATPPTETGTPPQQPVV